MLDDDIGERGRLQAGPVREGQQEGESAIAYPLPGRDGKDPNLVLSAQPVQEFGVRHIRAAPHRMQERGHPPGFQNATEALNQLILALDLMKQLPNGPRLGVLATSQQPAVEQPPADRSRRIGPQGRTLDQSIVPCRERLEGAPILVRVRHGAEPVRSDVGPTGRGPRPVGAVQERHEDQERGLGRVQIEWAPGARVTQQPFDPVDESHRGARVLPRIRGECVLRGIAYACQPGDRGAHMRPECPCAPSVVDVVPQGRSLRGSHPPVLNTAGRQRGWRPGVHV
ncbi:hypothetical protein AB0I50_24060 [Streptomyces prunicolor]